MTAHTTIAGLSPGDYAELLDSLRKDLQLDATVDILPGSVQQALFDQAGRASFLQLLTAQKLRVAVGSVSLTWSASTSSNVATITHGLGVAPTGVGGIGDGGGVHAFYLLGGSFGVSTFTLQGIAASSFSASHTAYWVAIG